MDDVLEQGKPVSMTPDFHIALVILKRSVSIPKEQWRLPSARRTLDPITVEPLFLRALREWRSNPICPAIVESDVSLDGGKIHNPVIRTAKQNDCTGVFLVQFVEHGVKLRTQEEACRKELNTPRRASRHLATLAFWKPVRVLLNGKIDWHEGVRFYLLQDYHIVLCNDSVDSKRKLFSSIQFFDLQADLI
jgi:hypothetical protein